MPIVLLAIVVGCAQHPLLAGARVRAPAAQSVPTPRASSRPRGDRRAWRCRPGRAPPRTSTSTAWRCRFLIARRSQHGRVIVEVHATLVDFHTGRNVRQVDPEASTYSHDEGRHAEIGTGAVAVLFPRLRALVIRKKTEPLPRRRAPCDRREAPLDRGLGPVGVAEGGLVTMRTVNI